MAEQARSGIGEVRVTIGAGQAEAALRDHTPPWTMLVCADFGFVSSEPRQVLIAEWDEFLQSCAPSLTGLVPGEPGMTAVAFEHSVRALHDLAPSAIESSLSHAKPVADLRTVIADVLGAAIDPSEAARRIRRIPAASPYRGRALALLAAPRQAAAAQSADGQQRVPGMHGLMEAVSADASPPLDREGLAQLASELDTYRQQELGRCLAQPFVNGPRAAWLALRHLAAAAGRSGTFVLAVSSSPRDRAVEHAAQALEFCRKQFGGVDLLLWDFPVRITMADMKTLARVGTAAAEHHTMALCSCAEGEPLAEAAAAAGSIQALMHSEAMVPLRRLRRNPVSRFLALCGPPVRLETEQKPSPLCGAAWLVAHDLERLLIDGGSPLTVGVPTPEDIERNFQFSLIEERSIPAAAVAEAHAAGVALLSDDPATERLPLPTLSPADDAGGAAAHFGYNLLLNRVRRLCAGRLSGKTAEAVSESVLEDLRSYVSSQLAPFHMTAPERAVRVALKGRTVTVEVATDRTAGEYPFRFDIEL